MNLKNTPKSELHRMLFELCETVTDHELDGVDGLPDWYGFQVTQRQLKLQEVKKRALAKLTEEERKVLGYASCEDEDEDEDY